jgi:hypothetical protein
LNPKLKLSKDNLYMRGQLLTRWLKISNISNLELFQRLHKLLIEPQKFQPISTWRSVLSIVGLAQTSVIIMDKVEENVDSTNQISAELISHLP